VSYPSTPSWPTVSATTSSEELAGLARQYGALVYRAAYRLVGSHAAAQDIQQDLFLRLLQRPLPAVRSWPAYLTTATVRLALNQLRRRRQWRAVLQFWPDRESANDPSPEQTLIAEQTAARLRSALARLKAAEAQCFTLRYVHNFEIAQVAESLGISENYVSVCLHRAIKRLEALQLTPQSSYEVQS
jgi:RNA polymerase sigma factor (sigma-70 family)